MTIEPYIGIFQRHNILIGVLLSALLTSIASFVFIPFGFFGFVFWADIFLVIGVGIGLYITFKNINESQSPIKTGLIVGLTGSLLSLVLIGLFLWISYSLTYGFDFILFLVYLANLFLVNGIMYAIVGIILGYFYGSFNKRKEI